MSDDGGPAFPQPLFSDGLNFHPASALSVGGMSLRDWFAGRALEGLLAGSRGNNPEIAEDAYAYADKMIRERKIEARLKK